MTFKIKQATKKESKLRLAIIGVSGSGKTYTSLKLASQFGNVCVIDTERGSASKYADEFKFDVIELDSFSPQTFTDAIRYVESLNKYDALVIDSLSHAWIGKDGALALVDNAAKRSQTNNTYTAWRDVTPMHNQMIDTIISSRLHIFVTMRAKQEYIIEQNERGKSVPRKVGLAPVQRDGMEFEFDVVGEMTTENDFIISKTRCKDLNGKIFNKPGDELATTLKDWLSGEPATDTLTITDVIQFIESCNSQDELARTFKMYEGKFKGTDSYQSLVSASKARKEELISRN